MSLQKKSTSKEPHRPCLSAQMENYTTEGAESDCSASDGPIQA